MEMINKKFDHQDTELRLGLPGSNAITCNKRLFSKISEESTSNNQDDGAKTIPPAPKVQIMGWPPVRSYRKNCLQTMKKEDGIFVKVSMDGAPYLRKIDMKLYNNYSELLKALEVMFKVEVGKYSDREGYKGSTYVPTYEDKDGDWMLVGDVPWEMFIGSCKRLRIMKGSEARGLGCMA